VTLLSACCMLVLLLFHNELGCCRIAMYRRHVHISRFCLVRAMAWHGLDH
jgi:hypothetical protein